MVILIPRDSRIAPRDAAAMPLPKEETTPPVTKTNLVMKILFQILQTRALTGMTFYWKARLATNHVFDFFVENLRGTGKKNGEIKISPKTIGIKRHHWR
jgi:hypothetical protein